MIARRLTGHGASRGRRRLDELWAPVIEVAVDAGLIAAAGRVADTHRLRALDACHLAAAKLLEDDRLVFVTWDAELGAPRATPALPTIPA